jgi:nucleotide-binding universal stress UspA family protein
VSQAERSGIATTGTLVKGVPAEVIVRVARREGADLIVAGTHGRSGLGRLFMGSVAARVLGTAKSGPHRARSPRRDQVKSEGFSRIVVPSLLGGVADRVVRLAPRPVLTVRGPA